MDKNTPQISIIVPVYKVEDTLVKCIETLINQTISDIEIILVDDGSPDNSGYICDQYALKDERIKVIHKENGGLASARNAGLDIARGEFIGFVDSDDYISLNMYEKMYKKINELEADICICGYYTVRNDKYISHKIGIDKNFLNKEEIIEKLVKPLIGNDLEHNDEIVGFVWRNLYKKELICSSRFKSEEIYFAEDEVFNIDAYYKSRKVCLLDEPLYYYQYNANSLSNKYRPRLWNKLINLLEYKKDVANQINIIDEIEERLNNQLIKMIIISIKNIKHSNCTLSQKHRLDEIKNIINHEETRKVIKDTKGKKYTFKVKILLILIKLRLNYIIYKLA